MITLSPLALGKLIIRAYWIKTRKAIKGRTAFSRKVWLSDGLYGNWGFHILYRKEWGTASTKAAVFVAFLRKEQYAESGFEA